MPTPTTPPVLIVDQNRGFRTWHISEIYVTNGQGRYVPNVNDMVIDWVQGIYRVTAVDYTTGLSTLVRWTLPLNANEAIGEDILLGSGPGHISESFRAYLDTSVMPYTLALDSRLRFYGSTTSYIKIFLGEDIGVNGQVISAFYDQSGTFVGDNIPLELVTMPDLTNRAVKTPMVGYTTQAMPDGEIVTVVAYDDAGQPTSIAKLLVKNTAFIRTTDQAMKYITDITVETPFLSATDPKKIEYPINMPVQNLNLIGVVNYSDGSKIRLPIDGTKFTMHGLENYIATIQGQEVPLVLSYRLAETEYSYILTPSPTKHISVPYKAVTLRNDGAYSVKLFAFPVWISALAGYRLEFFLYNLERQAVYNVTQFVEQAAGARAFNPIQYGVVQSIGVAVDLNRVDPRFAAYRHVQNFDITLVSNGNVHGQTNWTVGFTPGQNPPYGQNLRAISTFINVGNWQLDIRSGAANQTEWLNRVFYATQPLFDDQTEERAPEPNFFIVRSAGSSVELPISMWNSVITMTASPPDGGLITIEFIRRNATTDLQLGVAGMVVHYPDTPGP